MKLLLKNTLILLTAIVLLISCDEVSKNVEGKLDSIINDKTEQLDSIVNNEMNKVMGIDSLINNASSKLDSITNKKIESLKSIGN